MRVVSAGKVAGFCIFRVMKTGDVADCRDLVQLKCVHRDGVCNRAGFTSRDEIGGGE